MRQAIEEAKRTGLDIPVGCVIIDSKESGKIISTGSNRKEISQDPTDHAEIVALRKACEERGTWRLNDTILVTTLEPCPMCAEACIQARVETLVFGAYDLKSGACGSAFNLFVDRIYPIPEVIGGIEEQECTEILEAFFRSRRKPAT